ncbi:lysylphosphatidylglycerol synthase transmembrane domain-containing protein [Flavihumibacter profundi]|uniref:lysylphosphatidylglycerol synthase domain-containing protein n=1 Tax=Flavihumibacter profundi TaxID=2716883 RepID=UPI001CC7539C|nr:lysylphosphatidylglycerol synthase domain-containing protein [Flavihumibacter profundi]MBZ5858117.1 flippase-like domain-containing protein [Flavihumibacter profundi]
MLNNKNIKIFLNYWLGPIIFGWLAWSIYHQVKSQPDLYASWNTINSALNGNQAWKFWMVLFLMAVNWSIEARKWAELLAPLYPVSFARSMKAILAGLAFAVNTPNRIGEYGGRVIYLPEGKRLQAVSLTLIGSYSQLLVTVVLGSAGLWIFNSSVLPLNAANNWQSYTIWIRLLSVVMTTISVLLLLVYLRISWLVRFVEKIPGIEKWGRVLMVVDHLPVRILLRVLGWSMFRYVIFVIQYILLLQCFGVTNDIWMTWWMISILFLALAIVPTVALAELGIRGKLALELFGWLSANQLGIITATFSIWIVNLVLPAVLGSLLILRIKIFSTRAPQVK